MESLIDLKKNVDDLSFSEKRAYYDDLRKKCMALDNNQLHFGQNLIKLIYPLFRKYKLEIQGEENIPKDSCVLFVANHSNSHDIFTAYEIFSLLKRKGSVMVATDCLTFPTTEIFNLSNATLLDRNIKEERQNSVLELSSKLLNGNDGLIFGEGTWNLHPVKTMHNIQNGAAKVSNIAQVPIIPVIFEYIEKDDFVSSDSELFDKCIIRFGKPLYYDYNATLSSQSAIIKNEMTQIREEIWNDYSINKGNINNIDSLMYVNHTYAKKFKALGFTYDSKKEQEFLLFLGNEKRQNEYTINEHGILVPGITEKTYKLRK